METDANSASSLPTPEQARAALDDTEQVTASVNALSATPWPLWFTTCLTVYCAAIPIMFGGAVASPDWLLPRAVWWGITVGVVTGFLTAFVVAANTWRRKTGVAIRFDLLPKSATLTVMIGLPVVVLVALVAFAISDNPIPLYAASAMGAAFSIGAHLWFVRLHRAAV